MRKINFVPLPNKKLYKMREPWFCYMPKHDSVLDLEKKVLRCINYYMSSVRQDRSCMTMKGRLWKIAECEMEEIDKIDLKYSNYTHAAVDVLPISVTESQKKLKVDDLNFVDSDIFLLETPKQGQFVFRQQDGDDEESKESIANQMAEMAEQAQGLFSMEDLLAKNIEQLVHRRGANGLCGL